MNEDIFERIVSLRGKGATPRKDSAKMLVDETGNRYGTIGGGAVEETCFQEAVRIIHSGSSRILSFDLTGMEWPIELESIFNTPALPKAACETRAGF